MGCENIVLLFLTFLIGSNCQKYRPGRPLNDNKASRLPNLDVCGLSKTFDTRIIGGKPAEKGDYPWMAAIGYTKGSSQQVNYLCGGSLITDQYVITAAHCMHPSQIRNNKITTVRLGDLDLNPNVDDKVVPEDYEVDTAKLLYHPQYDSVKKINDIGLIKLKRKVRFTDNIKPICLPPPEFHSNLFVGYYPAVAGWGRSTFGSPRTDTRLLQAEVQIKDTTECRNNITSLFQMRNAVIDSKVVCAAAPGKDSCQGDSGGPLMLYRPVKGKKVGNFFLMGIVSYGYKCAEEGYPGVYTRASEYMAWIMKNLEI